MKLETAKNHDLFLWISLPLLLFFFELPTITKVRFELSELASQAPNTLYFVKNIASKRQPLKPQAPLACWKLQSYIDIQEEIYYYIQWKKKQRHPEIKSRVYYIISSERSKNQKALRATESY